jgi:hypothetical protein
MLASLQAKKLASLLADWLDNFALFNLRFRLMTGTGNRKEQLSEYCSEHGEMIFTVFLAATAGIFLVIAIV